VAALEGIRVVADHKGKLVEGLITKHYIRLFLLLGLVAVVG